MIDSKYLKFMLIEEKPKTKVYAIINKKHNFQIGIIKWYARWRQYCFYPDNETIWNSDCLNTIRVFLRSLMIKHKGG